MCDLTRCPCSGCLQSNFSYQLNNSDCLTASICSGHRAHLERTARGKTLCNDGDQTKQEKGVELGFSDHDNEDDESHHDKACHYRHILPPYQASHWEMMLQSALFHTPMLSMIKNVYMVKTPQIVL